MKINQPNNRTKPKRTKPLEKRGKMRKRTEESKLKSIDGSVHNIL